MIKKVISGGQTGVDTAGLDAARAAGLDAARAAGLATGGTMAHGYMQSIGRSQNAARNKEERKPEKEQEEN